ncbi:MAG: DoxX family membrane protein [Bacteroidota bacterium]|nr:DoxX family membrane protein [Bacteroidota bacterium]MDP4215875.1 DoxX family membrane protein [Bacteroidota bacterium]MDP4246652.1 DoxX family membrane protein [Bacteroidota bacterium]MDP4254133.1 DoxX family membrane protein [Bacteroidota bacterium]MDP4258390.1 DoxX family membrane protein [Bacteroidota bacterium]
MNLVQRVGLWGDRHHPQWLDIIRIGLGIFLCFKGYQFLSNMSSMLNLMTTRMSFGSFTLVLMSNYIAFAHVLGGLLLILGVLTRFACILQIPILLGAIFFINLSSDLYRPFSELALSILVFLLLVLFLIVGNGPWKLIWFREEKGD